MLSLRNLNVRMRGLLKSLYPDLDNNSIIDYRLIYDFRSNYKDKYYEESMTHKLKYIPIIENINYIIHLPKYLNTHMCTDIIYFMLFCEVEIFQTVNFIYNGEVMYSWDAGELYINQNYDYYILCFTFVRNIVCHFKINSIISHSCKYDPIYNDNVKVLFRDISTLYVLRNNSIFIDIYVSNNRILDLHATNFNMEDKMLRLNYSMYLVREKYNKFSMYDISTDNLYVDKNAFEVYTHVEKPFSIAIYDRLEFNDFDIHMLSYNELTIFNIKLLSKSRNYQYADWMIFDDEKKILY